MPDYLVATDRVPSSFSFDGRRIRPGERFVSQDARATKALIELGLAEPAAPQGAAELVYVRRDVLAPVPAQPKRGRGRPRRYGRRDMQAED